MVLILTFVYGLSGFIIFHCIKILSRRRIIIDNWTKVNNATYISGEINRDSTRGVISFSPLITYSYNVDGKTYKNTDYILSDVTILSRKAAEKELNKYAGKKSFTVYVDPNQPEKSCIVLINISVAVGGIIGGLIFALSVSFVLFKSN